MKALNLGVDFTAADFKSGLAEGLRFFAENEGPYLVHCTEGKEPGRLCLRPAGVPDGRHL